MNKYLFNFSVSPIGGGYKRAIEFVKAANNIGGCYFILHPVCKNFQIIYPNNKYYFINQNKISRLFFDTYYLYKILNEIGELDLYYSYGIPIYNKIAKTNWFHLSNVLPFYYNKMQLAFFEKLKMCILLYKIKKNLNNTDIISAESNFSLNILKKISSNLNLILSPNGNDDEIEYFNKPMLKENIAIILGTYKYKSLDISFKVFQSIQIYNPYVKLLIIGNQDHIPLYIKNNKNVQCLGLLNRQDVLKYLKICKYYITTTKLENSYNAAAEGAYFAEESFISDIEPHIELFQNIEYNLISIDNFNLIHIEKNKLNLNNLFKWNYLFDQIITLANRKF